MSELHALLIGIDAYLPNRIEGVGYYPYLQGCVRDVARVETYLRTGLPIPLAGIDKLTATAVPGSGKPAEPEELWPTYGNMVAAFERLTAAANPGDPVYIHYSGHGNRAKTAYPEIKGEGGLDEVLVPVDIGYSEASYLRDIEIAHFLRVMVDKGLLVTLVLDSCHSGSATRDEKPGILYDGKLAMPRGISKPDLSPRPTASRVASREELLDSWRWHTPAPSAVRQRDFQASTGWLPAPKGYVLIAACTSRQSAFEYDFEGDGSSGALTHNLLAALAERGPGATYETLFNRLRARVETRFPLQTPMLVGEIQRAVLGSAGVSEDERSPGPSGPRGVVVLAVEEDGHLRLNTGEALGVVDKARFAIHPPDADLASPGEPQAVVEVVQYGATASCARIVSGGPATAITPGSRAVLLDPGPNYRKTAIRLAPALGDVAALLTGVPYLRPAREGETADFQVAQVAVADRQEIEIQDGSGAPLPNLRPAQKAGGAGVAATVLDRLVHLAKYQGVRQLANPKAPPELAGKMVAELMGVEDRYDTTERPAPGPGEGTATLEMREKQWTFLRITNLSAQDLNIAVLDLQPDWGISQIYPGKGEENLFPLDSGRSFDLPLQAQLPEQIDSGLDVIKVFATKGPADFRWLELPPLDQPPPRGGVQRTMVSPPPPRAADAHPEWCGLPSEEWTTAQVEVRIRRSGQPTGVGDAAAAPPESSAGGRSWR